MAKELTQEDFDKYDAPNITAALASPTAIEDAEEAAGLRKPIAKAKDVKTLPEVNEAVKQTHARRTLATREAFDKVVEVYGDPLMELAKIGFDKGEESTVRVNALKELASYGHSKLKTIEHTGANGEPLEFKMSVVNNILQMLQPEDVHIIDQAK